MKTYRVYFKKGGYIDIEFCDSAKEAKELAEMPEYNRGRGYVDCVVLL